MIRLDNIGQYMENNRIEAKKAAGGLPQSLWETYAAFANTFGGLLLLGIEETRDHALQVNGINLPEKMVEDFWGILKDKTKVSENILLPEQVTIRDVGGKKVIVIEVSRAARQQKPIFIGEDPFRGSYRRCGEGDYRCTPDEVRSMLRNRDSGLDARVLTQFTHESFDSETVKRYRTLFKAHQADHEWNMLQNEPFLTAIGALKEKSATAAGLLMFGRERDIIGVFPGYYLDYREHTIQHHDACRILSGTEDWSGNICDFYFCVHSRLVSWAVSRLHKEHQEYIPLRDAVGEALANGIIHSDYDGGTGLVVEKSEEKLTITNPGVLRISPEQAMRGDVSDQRNETLSKLFSYVGVGSGNGRGLRSLRTIWKESTLGESSLREQFNPDVVTMSLTIEMDITCAQEIRERILIFLTENIEASGETLSQYLHIPQIKLDCILHDLIISGTVSPSSLGFYQLKR